MAPAGYVYHGVLAVVAVAVCLVLPPIVAYAPNAPLGLALCLLGAVVALVPGSLLWQRLLRLAGVVLLWAVIAWCALSQLVPILQPAARTVGWHLLPVSAGALVWCWLRFPLAWQRRTVVATLVPTVLGLGIVGQASPTQMQNFTPVYLAVDSHGTLYVTDNQAPAVRYFSPDGTVYGQILPGVGGDLGGKGSGMWPAGPLGDPDQTGIATAVVAATGKALVQEPWRRAAEEFIFCGIAIGARDRLYIPDMFNEKVLRFAPNGNMETRVDLPQDVHQLSNGCITANSKAEYMADAGGTIYQLDLAGNAVAEWTMPGAITGGIAVTPDGHWLYALGNDVLYRDDLRARSITSIPLPSQIKGVATAYTRLAALADGRVVLADAAGQRLEIVCLNGQICGTIGAPGALPGHFSSADRMVNYLLGQIRPAFGELAVGPTGEIYVSDIGNRAVQRFSLSGHVDAIYWSAYEYEPE